jgi:tetratricopeptide (TPR) repeat protein
MRTRYYVICVFILIVSQFLMNTCVASQEAAYKYNEEGLRKFKQNDFHGAIESFKAAALYDPANKSIRNNLAVTYNNYAFSLMKSGQLNSAIDNFERGLYYDPDNPYTLYNLGQAYYKVQNMQLAQNCLERAVKLKPDLKGAAALLERINGEISVEKGFERTDTMHFIIASSRDIPVSSFSYIRTYLEEAYGRIGMFLNHYPKNKVVVILYSEVNYGALLKGRPHWTLAVFDGKVRIPVNKFKYSNEEVIRIIYHEYAHAALFDMIRDRCPLWLNEGVAGRAEDFAGPRDKELIKKYISRFGLTPISSIPGNFTNIKDMNIATTLYLESYLLVDFIVRRTGYAGLNTMLTYLGGGGNIDGAIQEVFREDISSFEKGWKRYLIENYGIDNLNDR